MYIDDLTDAVVACAEAKGWKVEAGIIYKEQKSEFEFARFTHHIHRMKITSNKVIIYML